MHKKNGITYQENGEMSAEELAYVFQYSGIKRPWTDMRRLEKMLHHANILVTASYENQVIGVARGLADFSYCCYLSDLAVLRSFQGQGIGRELLAAVQRRIGEESALILLSAPEAMSYYPEQGFEKITNGFKIARKC
ncbi:GNAT family N-acetyltransferase [Alkalicoccus daliensis]|uniref:Acetyltransferase (GNAT) domain-containing protein n=1 Tax=Alkalicoccus daliensis TaxID=745820 RepID=A0A1G9ZDJ3_9BACI|nr:GNAT family N-acetyltransferase [Alkalicoccus daliensis]SDN19399.1 Acetyltransferase (GNAT) domain-containing protein [Alkalicoccus daliensis]